MIPSDLPLEDDFCDVLRKAMRGTGKGPSAIAERTGMDARAIDRWSKGEGVPDETTARALAHDLGLDPGKLADSAARRWHPHVVLPSDVRHHPHDPHPSNGYLFFLEDGRTAALVDPAGLPKTILDAIREGPYSLQYILITHKHADHCDATGDIARAFPAAQIVMHAADVHAIGSVGTKALAVADGAALPFGDAAEIRSLHTPGHTDGSTSYLFRSTLFTGDTLFAGSVGGAFGDVSTYRDILDSVRTKIFTLGDDVAVMPGHGPPSTVALEKAHNPFF